jgi:Zn-dependent peptidase ImmA (M78 family)
VPTLRCTNTECGHQWHERSRLAIGSPCPECDGETIEVTDWDEPQQPSSLAEAARQKREGRIGFARGRAHEILAQHHEGGPPVDVHAIAAALGLEVREKPTLGSLRGRLNEDVIEVPKEDHPWIKRFSIAHELGHVVLETTHQDGSPAEREANAFAGELLVPGPLLREQIQMETSVEALVRIFLASRPVLRLAAKLHKLDGQLTP